MLIIGSLLFMSICNLYKLSRRYGTWNCIAESLIFLFCSSEFSFLPSGVDIMLGRFSGLNWKLSGAKEAVPKDPKQCQYRIQGVSEILGSVSTGVKEAVPRKH